MGGGGGGGQEFEQATPLTPLLHWASQKHQKHHGTRFPMAKSNRRPIALLHSYANRNFCSSPVSTPNNGSADPNSVNGVINTEIVQRDGNPRLAFSHIGFFDLKHNSPYVR